jgi:hypothetical protein
VSQRYSSPLHPLLWAPLSTLGGQSLMGAFPSICVPALDDDAAFAMMRGLGSRQGIRFAQCDNQTHFHVRRCRRSGCAPVPSAIHARGYPAVRVFGGHS